MQCAVTALVKISLDHDIDGWLINIENELPINIIEYVILFLKLLTSAMHNIGGTHSEVIWYDAVTIEGKLQWQDELTCLNKPFFDACDGIFINYTWKECSLASTHFLLNEGSEKQDEGEGDESWGKNRSTDVYYGIDVFGRGTLGNGGYNCREALSLLGPCAGGARQRGCKEDNVDTDEHVLCSPSKQRPITRGFSAALFAPGWVLETQCMTPSSSDSTLEK